MLNLFVGLRAMICPSISMWSALNHRVSGLLFSYFLELFLIFAFLLFTDTSSVIFTNGAELTKPLKKPEFHVSIESVLDFFIKKDYMFATRKVINNTQLFISYRRANFVRADFQTDLDIAGMHIADVSGTRIMVAAVHNEHVAHLYVSESNKDNTVIKFVLSLENVFSYVPGLTWQSSWLV